MENDRIDLTGRRGSCEVPRGSRENWSRYHKPTILIRHMEILGIKMYAIEYIRTIRWRVEWSGNKERNSKYYLWLFISYKSVW